MLPFLPIPPAKNQRWAVCTLQGAASLQRRRTEVRAAGWPSLKSLHSQIDIPADGPVQRGKRLSSLTYGISRRGYDTEQSGLP